jgi:pyruvate/2-oxoglutarate dehydrogenase complex dihydrolipoamide dehydrogenase (E3) component
VTIDYDIVIIGGSFAGRVAAIYAKQLRATVALIEPETSFSSTYHAFREVSKFQQIDKTNKFYTPQPSPIEWQQVMLYAQAITSNVEEQHSPTLLAGKGIDVIVGEGQFTIDSASQKRRWGFTVNNRILRGRTYLLATGSYPIIPDIEGLQATGFFTLSNIWECLSQNKPTKNWVIIGGTPQSIEVAQTLARLGSMVTLVVHHRYILGNIDTEIIQLLQAQLEAEGVRVLTQTSVSQVRRIDDKKWLQVGDKAIETDEIFVAVGRQPNIQSLNLPSVGVKWYNSRLLVNDKLQTTNKYIYACGDIIGGYDLPNVANYEAKIAVKNALFFPRLKVNYNCIPWGINTQPTLAQIGLTEVQAKQHYRQDEVLVLRQYYKTLTAAQLQDETTGICKLIVLRHGQILGASIFGLQAAEIISMISLAIAQKIKVQDLGLSFIYPSFSEILQQIASQWHEQRLSSNFGLEEFLDDFFQFRRDWNL